jgi:hypothetical protein
MEMTSIGAGSEWDTTSAILFVPSAHFSEKILSMDKDEWAKFGEILLCRSLGQRI